MHRAFGSIAAALGAGAVVLGAFGAHALQGRLDETALRVWHTAVECQFWHALALIALAGCITTRASRVWRASAIAFIVGTLLFCGSLYALALGAPRWVGAITPLGGMALIAAWLLLGAAMWRAEWRP